MSHLAILAASPPGWMDQATAPGWSANPSATSWRIVDGDSVRMRRDSGVESREPPATTSDTSLKPLSSSA